MEAIKLVIIVEGGLIQDILTCGIPLEVVVVDYDTEGNSEDAMTKITDDSGHQENAIVSCWTINTIGENTSATRIFTEGWDK